MLSKKEIIQKLTSMPNRGAGTVSERTGHEFVAEQFRSAGIEAAFQDLKALGSMPLIHFIHFFSLFFISLFVNHYPLAGSILGLIVIFSFWGEFTYRFFLLRRLLPRRRSQNVVARVGDRTSPIKIVISAHIDAARTGAIFSPIFANGVAKAKKQPLHKTLFSFMLALTLVFVVKAFGGGTWILSVIFNAIAILALLGSLIMLQWEFAPYSPGANDDLSGVAVLMSIAEKYTLSLPSPVPPLTRWRAGKGEGNTDIEYIFVVTGSEESHCNGMREFVQGFKGELPKEGTFFINLECVGGGAIKYVTDEGFIVMQRHHHTLIQICETAAKRFDLNFGPAMTVAHSDSIVPLTRGYRSIGIIGLNENYLPSNYHTMNDREENIDYGKLEEAQRILECVLATVADLRKLGYI